MSLLAAVPRLQRDPLWDGKVLNECWSLVKSGVFYGEIPVPSAHTKEIVIAEACLWEARRKEADRYRSLESRLQA